MLKRGSPPFDGSPSTGILAVMKRLSSPAFTLSRVTSVRGLALNLISTWVLGMRVKPRYLGSRVMSPGRGAASCWLTSEPRSSIAPVVPITAGAAPVGGGAGGASAAGAGSGVTGRCCSRRSSSSTRSCSMRICCFSSSTSALAARAAAGRIAATSVAASNVTMMRRMAPSS
jgi:hypothetical protein